MPGILGSTIPIRRHTLFGSCCKLSPYYPWEDPAMLRRPIYRPQCMGRLWRSQKKRRQPVDRKVLSVIAVVYSGVSFRMPKVPSHHPPCLSRSAKILNCKRYHIPRQTVRRRQTLHPSSSLLRAAIRLPFEISGSRSATRH